MLELKVTYAPTRQLCQLGSFSVKTSKVTGWKKSVGVCGDAGGFGGPSALFPVGGAWAEAEGLWNPLPIYFP